MNTEETEAIRRAADWLAERRERESARLLRAAQDLAERLAGTSGCAKSSCSDP
jgi:cell division septum initiation protein DivIVA